MLLRRILRRLPLTAPLVLATLSWWSLPAAFAQPLELSFTDSVFEEPEPLASPWLDRALRSGASFVRLNVEWAAIAPSRPADPVDPSDPAYHWQRLDDIVRTVAAGGVKPAITVYVAPVWAESPGQPRSVPPGAWRPDPVAYGQFARALARRYSGAYPDPLRPGVSLPRVRYWQAWNEPNLAIYLAPQWVQHGRGFSSASPAIYRSLLNSFYRGIKASSPNALVISAGTAPFGDLRPDEHDAGNQRMAPVDFVRELFCLRSDRLLPQRCGDPAHLDILDHHPYAIYGPFTPALNAGDVTIPDLGKLTSLLHEAETAGHVLPHGHKALWVTEVGYDSDPPDPHGVPMRTHARWVEQTLYELWSEGASTVSWNLIRDSPPIPSYAATSQSGMYFYDGAPKLSEQAFRFPFVVASAGRGHSIWWTRAPVAGRLFMQQSTAHGWRTLYTTAVREHQVLERPLPRAPRHASWRAIVGRLASLSWPL